MNNESSRLGPVLTGISVLGSLVLIVMGIVFALDHVGAAKAYGVPLFGGDDNAWISSAALRDVAFGALGLTFALFRDRRAMGLALLFGALIPMGDASVVLRNSATPLLYMPLHIGGAIVCLVLAVIFLRPLRQK